MKLPCLWKYFVFLHGRNCLMRKLGACCQAVYIWGSVLRIHTAFNEACCMWSHSSNMPAFSLKRLEQPQAIFITPQEEITQTPVVFSTSVDLKGFVLESKEWIFVEILHWEEEQQLAFWAGLPISHLCCLFEPLFKLGHTQIYWCFIRNAA